MMATATIWMMKTTARNHQGASFAPPVQVWKP